MIKCIFCKNETDAKSIEHIVSESLGNRHYVMERGRVCDKCNGSFSNFEGEALSGSVLLVERARMAIKTKKGKSVFGSVGGLEVKGDNLFRKELINFYGFTEDNFELVDAEKGIAKIKVPNFNKSSTSITKLMLKVGFEALFTSHRKLYKQYNFDELCDFILNKNNADWPFVFSSEQHSKFHDIPRFNDKHELKKIRTELKFSKVDGNTLLFQFIYGGISMKVNLLGRDVKWIEPYNNSAHNGIQIVFPEKFDEQLNGKKRIN